jgi:hypothetical protein
MRVYHFLSAMWALDDIRKKRIKISVIDQLNDPFELWCVEQRDKRLRQALRGFKAEMVERFGMICFSKHWHNPLLWSHYADKHRGICLGFDVDDRGLKLVTYANERPSLRVPPTVESINELLFTKFRDWGYEEELRNWFRLDVREGEHYFYPFDTLVRLREVIVGPLCGLSKAEIEKSLEEYSGVSVLKARLAFKTFRVVKNQKGFPQ